MNKEMAGKAHVDDSVIERRLRPIYDWLDNGNNKKAVQEADKVLRKQPKLHCASVLKALALLRLGRNSESSEIVNNVVAEGTCDDATLQALTICYREMHQPELICSMYENAFKLDPTNEDIISHLFMSYVRVGNYKKQQQTAMQLYKLKPKNPYYFWAIMSIVMQAHTTKDSVSRKVSLQLAERMILKFVNEDKIESEAEVLTYLYILEIQEKYEDALSAIDGPLARKIIQQPQNFMTLKRALYSTRLNKFESASIIYMNLILEEPDNWQHYVFFIDTILSMWKRNVKSLEEKADPLQEASKFLIDSREKSLSIGAQNRSPFLGLLQFALRLQEEGLQDKIGLVCGNVTDLLFNYIQHTGDKMCCYTDIVNFLPLVSKDEVSSLLERVSNLIEKDGNGIPSDIRNIYRHQIWLQLRRAYGREDGSESERELIEFADTFVRYYQNTAHFSADMAPTDIRPNDTYLIMASHTYFEALNRLVCKISSSPEEVRKELTSITTNLLMKLCCLLEHGINISKANFQLKLLLIKAYNLIGASIASYRVYEKLDLKQIQMDTMGHVLAFQALDTGHFGLAFAIFSTTLKFFMANYKDTSDPLIMSYKYGSLCRIPEFVEFRERLNNSLHFATVTTEQMILELTSKGNSKAEVEELMSQLDIDPANEKTEWDDLRDNRDLFVMNLWKPQDRKVIEDLKKETFADDVIFLKLRNTTLRIVAAAHALGKRTTGHNKANNTINNNNNNNNNNSSNNNKNNSKNKENSSMVNGTVNGPCEEDVSSPASVLKNLIEVLSSQIQDCDIHAKSVGIPQIPLQGPEPSRLHLYTKGFHHKCLLKHAEAVLRIYNCTEGSEGLDAWSNDVMKGLNEVFDQELSFLLPQLDTLQVRVSSALPWVNAQPLGHLSHFLQNLSLILILLECCNHFLIPLKGNVTKKNKKKKGSGTVPEIVCHYNTYVSSFQTKLQKFESAFNEKFKGVKSKDGDGDVKDETMASMIKEGFDPASLESLVNGLDWKVVYTNIEQSFSFILCILNPFLQSKLKFLNSLKV